MARTRLRIAVMGAGLIGKRHIDYIRASPEAELAAVIDPAPAAREIAGAAGVPWFERLNQMPTVGKPDGIIVATPNQFHVENGLECIDAGIPVLMEKPIADDVDGARRLVARSVEAGVPLLVGHHRRHNPIMARARQIVESGRLGRPVVAHAMFWIYKPDDYFDAGWRRQPGAGPVLINLIHDVDNLRFLLGDVDEVLAMDSAAARGFAVEDTAVAILRFRCGVLATITGTDTAVAPWSWEMTSGENAAYPYADQSCYLIGGTHGSLSIPDLTVWSQAGKRSWWEPLAVEPAGVEHGDPLALQLSHFCRVIRGTEQPVVGGEEGLRTLEAVMAIKAAAGRRA